MSKEKSSRHQTEQLFERLMPPGASLRPFFETFFWGIGISAACSMGFLIRFADRKSDLYYKDALGIVRMRGDAVMPDFVSILGGCLWGFYLTALVMLAFILVNYTYYRRGTKSIYTMRRLPSRREIHKRSLPLPLLAAITVMVLAFIVLMIYYAIYMCATPEQCLRPDQWAKLWREIL